MWFFEKENKMTILEEETTNYLKDGLCTNKTT